MFVLLLVAGAQRSAQASQVRSYSRTANGVQFSLDRGILDVQVCTDRIVHVVYTLRQTLPRPVVPAIKEDWIPSRFTVRKHGDFIRISTAKIIVSVARENGSLSFFDKHGNPILKEPTSGGKSLTPTSVAGENTWEPEQIFLSPDTENFYGLGQHQEGFLNWRNIPLRLQQVDANIAMPVVLSNRGYGLIWNSAALTDFNPTDEVVALDPVTHVGHFKTRAAGTYGFLATGGTGREHIGLRVNGAPIAGLDGYLVPYAVSGKSALKANMDYVVQMDGAGTDANIYIRIPSDTVGFRSEVGDAVDYYFLYGPDLNDVVAEYRDATGSAPLFPKWAYGFWQCRERYSRQDQLLAAAAGFRQRQIPVDVMVQDWQYWGKFGWNAMKFDEQNYPDAAAMIRALHGENLHFVISVWSKFDPQTEISARMKAQSLLISGTDWFDAFNPKAREQFWRAIDRGLFKLGVDGWWLDATEPEGDPLKENHVFPGLGNFVRNAYPLLVTRAVYEGQRGAAPEKRVVILTRSAFLGEQKYAAGTWSGDIGATWPDFGRQIAAGLGLTAAGIPYWTTDVGGFIRPDDQYTSDVYHELLTRWFEYGVFSPLFRIHGNESETEIWNYGPQVESTFRKYDDLRYRLLPYIYSTAWRITQEGYNLMRALPLDYREDAKTADISDEFMFGPSLLVSPVTAFGARSRTVYLPNEPGWVDFWTGNIEPGGQQMRAEAPLDQIPIFAKVGSIVPLGPPMQYATEMRGPIELRIYPGKNANFMLYDDDGGSYGYENGNSSRIFLQWDDTRQTLTIGPREGSFPGMPPEISFRIVRVRPGHGTGSDPVTQADAEIRFHGPQVSIGLRAKQP